MPCAGPELSELCLLNYESFVLLFNLKWFQQLPFSQKSVVVKKTEFDDDELKGSLFNALSMITEEIG